MAFYCNNVLTVLFWWLCHFFSLFKLLLILWTSRPNQNDSKDLHVPHYNQLTFDYKCSRWDHGRPDKVKGLYLVYYLCLLIVLDFSNEWHCHDSLTFAILEFPILNIATASIIINTNCIVLYCIINKYSPSNQSYVKQLKTENDWAESKNNLFDKFVLHLKLYQMEFHEVCCRPQRISSWSVSTECQSNGEYCSVSKKRLLHVSCLSLICSFCIEKS